MKPDDQSVKQRWLPGEILIGIAVGTVMHVLQLPLAIIGSSIKSEYGLAPIIIGVTQLIYIVPAIVICLLKRRSGIAIGLTIIAAITFLLNATCWGLISYISTH
jgi:hypothetical protein